MKLSFVLVSLGAILASVAAAGVNSFKLTPNMWLFISGILLTVIGGFVRKQEVKREVKSLEVRGELKPREQLKDIISSVEGVSELLEEGRYQEAMDEVNRITVDLILNLMDKKDLLREKWSSTGYAEFAMEFAYAERYLNRCFSALVDEYYDEAAKSIDISLSHFRAAGEILNRLEGVTS